MMIVVAPAKLNLTLEVLKKREDGYHEIKSVFQTFNLCDILKFSAHTHLEYRCNLPEWDPGKSLVSKAAELLRKTVGPSSGALIEISKRIPLTSGLGGDSSDAVAVLRGLNMLWNLRLAQPDMLKLAAQLGSDVSAFIHGGTLLVEGRGEKVTPIIPVPHMSVVLLAPSLPVVENKTTQMYSQLKTKNYSKGQYTENFLNILSSENKNPISGLYNVFDSVGLKFFKGLEEYRQHFLEAGAKEVHLAGSGPTLYTLIEDEVAASNIHKKLQERGLQSYLADF
jgi:4-diphosphocytidyl-2-C-methyl-D-erythritol kinase